MTEELNRFVSFVLVKIRSHCESITAIPYPVLSQREIHSNKTGFIAEANNAAHIISVSGLSPVPLVIVQS